MTSCSIISYSSRVFIVLLFKNSSEVTYGMNRVIKELNVQGRFLCISGIGFQIGVHSFIHSFRNLAKVHSKGALEAGEDMHVVGRCAGE